MVIDRLVINGHQRSNLFVAHAGKEPQINYFPLGFGELFQQFSQSRFPLPERLFFCPLRFVRKRKTKSVLLIQWVQVTVCRMLAVFDECVNNLALESFEQVQFNGGSVAKKSLS